MDTRALIDELRNLPLQEGIKVDRSALVSGAEYLRNAADRARERAEPPMKPDWRRHRESLKEKFPEGWNPPRRVERSDMNTIRRLHSLDPIQFSTPNLADKFKISPEAVRRILKSKFRTEAEEEEARVGEQLLKEAELGTYDKTQQNLPYYSKRMAQTAQEDAYSSASGRRQRSSSSSYPERTSTPAKPLQEGFDPNRLSKNYKWAAGRKSKYAHATTRSEESERVYSRQPRWRTQRDGDAQEQPGGYRRPREYQPLTMY